MSAADDATPDRDAEYSYEAFGRHFFEYAVTQARIESALSNIAGNRIDFGPRNIGPGGLARVSAKGQVDTPQVRPREGDRIGFDVTVPVRIELDVGFAGQRHRFDAELLADLRLTVRALRPLRIFIDVAEPTERDVRVEVAAQGLGASLLNRLADVEGELQRYVARYIARQIDKPEIRKMREIDVAQRLEKSWTS